MNKCLGCGVTLQDQEPNTLGYTPNLDNKYCQRCFQTIHYNKELKVSNLANQQIIAKINKLKYPTIFISDLISLNSKVINIYKSIKNPKILVINKCDLIPQNLKLEHLAINIKNVFNIDDDIYFISAKNNINLNNILDFIAYYKNVIFSGETSSGKSTLINKLFKTNLTTSKYANTTLDFIKIKKDKLLIYDSPGLYINSKKDLTKIQVLTKKLSNDFILSIDDLKIKGSGNITCFLNNLCNVKSKKEDLNLSERIILDKDSDIELDNGFIMAKKNTQIITNQKLNIRNSIIRNYKERD